MKSEPAITVASIVAAVSAILTVLAAFGIGVSKSQQDAILNAIPVLVPVITIIGGVVIRSRVTPTAKAEEAIHEAYFADPAKDAIPTLAKVG